MTLVLGDISLVIDEFNDQETQIFYFPGISVRKAFGARMA